MCGAGDAQELEDGGEEVVVGDGCGELGGGELEARERGGQVQAERHVQVLGEEPGVVGPDAGDFINQRFCRVGIFSDEAHRKI